MREELSRVCGINGGPIAIMSRDKCHKSPWLFAVTKRFQLRVSYY
jgi:hypothetical protein